jgi:hypothetical protein
MSIWLEEYARSPAGKAQILKQVRRINERMWKNVFLDAEEIAVIVPIPEMNDDTNE